MWENRKTHTLSRGMYNYFANATDLILNMKCRVYPTTIMVISYFIIKTNCCVKCSSINNYTNSIDIDQEIIKQTGYGVFLGMTLKLLLLGDI